MVERAVNRALLDEMVGQSPCMRQLRERMARLARYDVNLLLQGESGTGKELVARTIHRQSQRAGRPFIGVNCAAIHESLLESELFGHEAGAFTGATHATLGFLRAAEGGTILLDEVGDMSESLQSKLLRVLEERAVVPVGGTQPVPIDLRVISATHRNLSQAVQEGSFRQDLYYRLNVVCLSIAPLRRRRGDIPLLVEHMLGRIAGALRVPVKKLSAPTYGRDGELRLARQRSRAGQRHSARVRVRRRAGHRDRRPTPRAARKERRGEDVSDAEGDGFAARREGAGDVRRKTNAGRTVARG